MAYNNAKDLKKIIEPFYNNEEAKKESKLNLAN